MDTSDLKKEYRNMVDDLHKFKKDSEAKGQALFKKVLAEFFVKVPEVSKIVWTQYTPYFNDGDSCEFGVNDPAFVESEMFVSKLGKNEDEVKAYLEEVEDDLYERNIFEEPRDYIMKSTDNWAKDIVSQYETTKATLGDERLKEVQAAISEVKDLWQSLEAVVFLMAFGDHVRIIASKDSIDVDDYDHD